MLAEKIIRKHVSIIHAYSLMSVLQRKIVNVFFYEATKKNNQPQQLNTVAVECQMSFAALCKAIKFNSNNTHYLKEAIDGLASLTIEWNLLRDKVPTEISFLNLRILHGAPTFYQNRTFTFSFHKVMFDLVDSPFIYGTLDVDLQADFESKYSHALYENSTRFVNLQKNKVVSLDIFRKILGVHEDAYVPMREFTRNVITPAVEEVNDRAQFSVKLESIKIGRKIIGFEVAVKNKRKLLLAENSISAEKISNENLINEIKQTFGEFNELILENILTHYSEEYIFEKIIYTKKHAKKSNTGFYPIPYFISAIKHDYKIKEEIATQEKSLPVTNAVSTWEQELATLQADLQHWKKVAKYANPDENIKKLILTCQEKIKKHCLEKPLQTEIV